MNDSFHKKDGLNDKLIWNDQDQLMASVMDDIQVVIAEFSNHRYETDAISEALNCIVDVLSTIEDEIIKGELITIHKSLEEIRQGKAEAISISALNQFIFQSTFFRTLHLKKALMHISTLAEKGAKSLLMKVPKSVSYRFVLPDELDAALCMSQ